MSNRYKGGVISATPPTTSGGESGTASGAWTLEQQMQLQAAGLWPSQPPDPNLFIENLFSTWLYNGTGSAQTITNGINFSTNGGLLWLKARNDTRNNWLYDTTRSIANGLRSDSTAAATSTPDALTAFNSNGFSIGTSGNINTSGNTLVSWSFRKQAKFFDVVTWTGDGTIGRTISHSLGSVPGCIIVKRTNGVGDWVVYHRSLGATKAMILNLTDSVYTWSVWNDTAPTSTVFSLNDASEVNGAGNTYVAYLFAHNAGGFGLTGTDNVISCGSVSATGSTLAEVNLGWEPQWLLIKGSNITNGWSIIDNMRGFTADSGVSWLQPNTSAAEVTSPTTPSVYLTSTGFKVNSNESPLNGTGTYIYIAIRRGPMKVPTSGTSVFSPNTANTSAGTPVVTNFPVDLSISVAINGDTRYFSDRLRGVNSTGQTANQPWVASNSTGAELTNASIPRGWDNTQILLPPYYAGGPTVWWNMRRAPSFFDEVCYTGTGSNTTVAHNLTVVPELLIVKRRDATASWHVGSNLFPNYTDELYLNSTASIAAGNVWQNTPNTTTYFTLATNTDVNASGGTYTAYLFATAAGVSKVGLYTGTGAAQTINCGFAAGCRFVFIKRTDASGDWYVWDSTRGIVAGNDPYLTLNTYDAEVTNTDYVDTAATGFEISSTAPAAINANGGTYIFLAIA